MMARRLADDVADPLAGIQRRHRILEDELHFQGCFTSCRSLERSKIFSPEMDAAIAR